MNKKDKIFIILVSEFPPGQNGGIAHWANNLYTTLNSSGIKVIVLTRKTRSHRKLNIRSTKTLKYISGHSWQKMSWLYILPYLLPVLATHKHVTVIAATWHNVTKIHYLKKIFPLTLYCSARGTEITKAVYPPDNRERLQLQRVLKNVDILIPISSFLDQLVRKTFPALPFKSVVIGNDVDHNLFMPVRDHAQKKALRKKLKLPEDAPLLLTVGRMVAFKGFPDLIKALKPVTKVVPEFILLMVSAPREPEYSKIIDAIESQGLEKNILIKNPVEHHELPAFYQAADVFVLYSKAVYEQMYQEEGFGRTSIEAAACGLPVVVSDTGGQPETVIHEQTGYIVPAGNGVALSERILTLLIDKKLAHEMGERGREFVVKTFTSEIMRDKILQLDTQ